MGAFEQSLQLAASTGGRNRRLAAGYPARSPLAEHFLNKPFNVGACRGGSTASSVVSTLASIALLLGVGYIDGYARKFFVGKRT
jgi:hypothetical protein